MGRNSVIIKSFLQTCLLHAIYKLQVMPADVQLTTRFEGTIPEAKLEAAQLEGPRDSELGSSVHKLDTDVAALLKEYIDAMEKIKLREGIKIAMSISSLGNKFFQVCFCQASMHS